jgi:hypothetical protein
VDRFAAIAKAAGMPTAYAQRALDFFASRIDARASTRPNRDDAVKTLRAEWGDAFRAKARAANHAMDVLGLRGAIQRAGLLDDVPLARYLADLGAWIAKNPAVPSRTQQARAELRGDVQRRYDEIMNAGPTHPYWSRRDPVAHKAAVAEVERLAAVLFGAGPANPDTEGTSRATADYGETLATRAVEAQRIMSSWLADPKHPVNNRHHAEHHEAVRHFQNLTRIIAQAQQEPHAAAILRQDINRATAPPRLGTGHASRRRG